MKRNKAISSHVIYVPTRTGMSVPNLNKTECVGSVIPAVLKFPESVCVMDPHHEPEWKIKGGKHD
jgi:hypothetical protein